MSASKVSNDCLTEKYLEFYLLSSEKEANVDAHCTRSSHTSTWEELKAFNKSCGDLFHCMILLGGKWLSRLSPGQPVPRFVVLCRRWFLLSARKREDDRSVLHLVEKCRLWGFSFNPPTTIDGCTISWLMIDPHLKVRVSCSSFFSPTPPLIWIRNLCRATLSNEDFDFFIYD